MMANEVVVIRAGGKSLLFEVQKVKVEPPTEFLEVPTK